MKYNTKRCMVCKKTGEVDIPGSEYFNWAVKGMHIQDAMPSVNVDDREQIITGTHKECWDKLFGPEE